MKEKFLPLGTVVLIKGGTKKVMITGFCAVTEEDKNKIWDYRGCPFPEGIMESEGVALFDHDQISEIVHIGFENPESINFSDRLNIIIERQSKKAKDTE